MSLSAFSDLPSRIPVISSGGAVLVRPDSGDPPVFGTVLLPPAGSVPNGSFGSFLLQVDGSGPHVRVDGNIFGPLE